MANGIHNFGKGNNSGSNPGGGAQGTPIGAMPSGGSAFPPQQPTTPDVLENYNEILNALNGQFLTNMDMDDIFKLIAMQLEDNRSWDIITYHLGGEGKIQGTASMGWDRMLYTVNLFDSQVDFIRNEIEKMNNDQRIKQQALPNETDTTYIPN